MTEYWIVIMIVGAMIGIRLWFPLSLWLYERRIAWKAAKQDAAVIMQLPFPEAQVSDFINRITKEQGTSVVERYHYYLRKILKSKGIKVY